MTTIAMNDAEIKSIDTQVEQMMDWAKTRRAEAEQLALDSARLMGCTTDRVDRIKNQGFFKRCWNRFTGKTGEMERANTGDLIQMQKVGLRYMNMLQEQQMLMAHSLLSLKNNLVSLAVKEEETRNIISALAQKTLERFEGLESRVDQLEISTNLQGWLLSLEEREYDEKIPTDYMRLFRVINDFYQIKNDNWNYTDLMFMRKAIRTVGLNPKQKLSLNAFIDKLTDEIQSEKVGFDAYGKAITVFQPQGIDNYSKFVIENISSPVFVSMHGLKTQYQDKLDVVEELQDEMNITANEALKRLLRRSIKGMSVNMDYEFPLAETAIEILGCLRLGEQLALPKVDTPAASPAKAEIVVESSKEPETKTIEIKKVDVNNMTLGSWKSAKNLPRGDVEWVMPGADVFFVCMKNGENRTIFDTQKFDSFNAYANFDAEELELTLPYFINNELIVLEPGRYSGPEVRPIFIINKDNVERIEIQGEFHDESITYRQVLFAKDKWYVIGQYSGNNDENKYILGGTNLRDLNIINFKFDCDYKYFDIVFDGKNFATIVTPNRGQYCDDYDLALSSDMKKWESYLLYEEDCIDTNDASNIISFNGKIYFYRENKIYSMSTKKITDRPYSTVPFEGKSYKQSYLIDCNYQEYGIALCSSGDELAVSNDLRKWVMIDSNFPVPTGRGIFGFGSKTEVRNTYTYSFGKLVFWRQDNIFFRTME